ncbi:MAG: F0F1 ATP synthase subunit A [Peptococcaceae bacterium]|nr:F0F1 ATP synthase subunit A [Peptococcaceae bacterium]
MRGLEEVEKDLDFWGFMSYGHHGVVHTPIGDVNIKTLIMTWLVMALIALVTFVATRKMKVDKPGTMQVIIEEIFTALRGLVYENIDYRKGAGLVLLIFTLFIFLLFSNLLGLIPTMMSPTADINTTLGLALTVFILVHILGLRFQGKKYFKHYFEPYPVFLPLHLIEELSKPLTLSFRLYGNIYAGEVLVAVLLGMMTLIVNMLGGFVFTVVWLSFSIFVSCIQALIFTMLTIAYISQKVAEDH